MNRAMDRLRSLRVCDVMTKQVFTVSGDDSLSNVLTTYSEKDISFAPVVDKQQRCIGVISAIDFLGKGFTRQSGGDYDRQELVRDRMSRSVHCVAANELLLKAAQVMSACHVHRLPVLGPRGVVEGVISTMDITSAVVNAVDEADATPSPTMKS